jgi:uncharacterized iron-regulated membrane protein
MNAGTSMQTLASLAARRRSLFWRIHFWAALIASPFALVATLTGMLYIFTPQIEAALYGHLERVTPVPAAAMLPLDVSVAAARAAVPAGFEVQSVVPPAAPGAALKIGFGRPTRVTGEHAAHAVASAAATPARAANAADNAKRTVFVDPYNARVLGTQLDQDRFSEWARRLHSRLLQGETLRWMIELAASWMLVMLLTGVYLWWPQSGQPGLPRAGARGRQGWRQWHAFLGVLLGVLSLVIVLTGITWSKYAGTQVRSLRDWSGQASPPAPAHLHSMPPGGPQLSYQQAWQRAQALVPGVPLQLTPPRGAHGIWRIASADRSHPGNRLDLVLNAYDGRVLYRAGWEGQTAFGKATAVGIPFHRGELGVWNQVLLFVFAAGVLFSLLSGWVMFFKRRRAGQLGLPKLLPGAWRSAPVAWVIVGAGLCALMPLLALSTLVLLGVELALARARTLPAAA